MSNFTEGAPGSIVIVGAGMCGLLTGMLLAEDGHEVTIVERDAAEPPHDPLDAWLDWDRRSVRQFRMGHFFLPRFRGELEANLPAVLDAMIEAGAYRTNPLAEMPETFSGGFRDGDERFESITGRRPIVEAVIARCAAKTPGLSIRRGQAVSRLVVDDSVAPVQVTGVELANAEELSAELVVDTTGRNSGLPKLLAAAGAGAVRDEADDTGFVYYGRTFRSPEGTMPASMGGGLQPYGSISTLTLAADNNTWQIAFVASGRDAAMRKVRDVAVFNELWRSFPLVAHWIDGEPLSDDVAVMGNLEDRLRHFVVDGKPVATGLAAVGDSWACSNPSVGRGSSMALMHAVALRDQLRESSPVADPVAWSLAWDQRTSQTVLPYYRETLEADRHRIGQIEAALADEAYSCDDPVSAFREALPPAAFQDPASMRAWLESFMMLRTVADVMTDEQLVARTVELGAGAEAGPGPDRKELEALLS